MVVDNKRLSVAISDRKVDFDQLIDCPADINKAALRIINSLNLFKFRYIEGFSYFNNHFCFVVGGKTKDYIPFISLSVDVQNKLINSLSDIVRFPDGFKSDVNIKTDKYNSYRDAIFAICKESDFDKSKIESSYNKYAFDTFDLCKDFLLPLNVSSLFPFFYKDVDDNQRVGATYFIINNKNEFFLSVNTGGAFDRVFINEYVAQNIIGLLPDNDIKRNFLSIIDENKCPKIVLPGIDLNVLDMPESDSYVHNCNDDVDFTVLFSSKNKSSETIAKEDIIREAASDSLITLNSAQDAYSSFLLRDNVRYFLDSLPDEYLKGTPCSLNIVDVSFNEAGIEKCDGYDIQAFSFLSEIQLAGVKIEKIVCSGNSGFEEGIVNAAKAFGIKTIANVPACRLDNFYSKFPDLADKGIRTKKGIKSCL